MSMKDICAKAYMKVSPYMPKILTGLGVTGLVGTVILACRETRRIDPILEEHRENLKKARESEDRGAFTKEYVKTGGRLVKLYSPSIATGVVSTGMILTGNHMLSKRNLALAAAYATIDSSYRKYREEVTRTFGKDADIHCRYGTEIIETEETEVDAKGKEKKVKRKCVAVKPDSVPYDYSRYFCRETTPCADGAYEYQLIFLNAQIKLFNTILRARHYLYLNEVYRSLGFKETLAGQTVGWVYDEDSDDHGDNLVDFGGRYTQDRYEYQVVKRMNSLGEWEDVILLDFNVDGPITEHAIVKGLMEE